MAWDKNCESIWKTRPSFSDPSPPEEETVVPDKSGKCGSFWGKIKFKDPYGDTETLPKLVSAKRADLKETNSVKRAEVVRDWVSRGLTHDVISNAEKVYHKYKKILGSKDREAIESHIELARDYAIRAKALWAWWNEEYVPIKGPLDGTHYKTYTEKKAGKDKTWKILIANSHVAPHWRLSAQKYAHCDMEGGYDAKPRTNYKINNSNYVVYCPQKSEIDAHSGDAALYCKLVIAAVSHARCAAEMAAGIAFKKSAAKFAVETTGKLIEEAKRSKDAKMKSIAAGAAVFMKSQPPMIGADPAGTTGTGKTTAKKKDNTMLIVGAAAIGLLMMMKK